MKPIVLYDSSKEDLLDKYLCELDMNPNICSNPIEDTSYLGYKYNRNNIHRHIIKKIVKDYEDYIQEFIKSNQSSPEAFMYVETTLIWVLSKLKNAHKQFLDSPLRNEWRMTEHMPEWIERKESGGRFIIEYNSTRAAFIFFRRVSGSQKYYLKELIEFIYDQLLPIKVTNNAMIPYNKTVGKGESENVYVFRLTSDVAKEAGEILSILYSGLKKHGYINCSAHEFKKLFINHSNDKPLKSPTPIIWQSEYYNHLAYFVKCLVSNKIITSTKFPSNYKIALQLFYDRGENNPYHPSKERYDGNLNPKDRAKIDSIIEESLNN